ncbi:CHASE2 domain-containing protein [Pseudomonas sp. C2B4]|uniref:CHASE2 domain-containing protein n=1 Tax=Pseudomonas sp. C2B4 TaxID=2735270 RepID=UPI001585D501|nr:CHASE2 domain-containing protein [Pseudomonas sp. C2B4]NUU34644.1 CHASE2 domain-containing protein [Pseudomonas sp. C2B4]
MPARSPLFSRWQVVLGVLVLAMALLDPFGLASSSNNASAQWLNRVFASKYQRTGQQQVAVILIDDAYLMRNNTHWPMPYDEQSKLFKRLLAYKPKAVFVDLMYSHDHSLGDPAQGSQLLANVFERYRHQGIALLLANTGQVRGEEGQANTLANLAEVSSPALVAWSGFGDKYPLAVEMPLGPMETPALLLYRQYCQSHSCADLPSDTQAAVQSPPIAIQWGINLAPEQMRIADIGHCSAPGNVYAEMLKAFFQAIFWKMAGAEQSRCLYNFTLSASDLEVSTPQDRALLAELLRDRLVLVGANITSTGDLVESPVHGQVPGIYLHAMALDNLVTQGMNYDREPADLLNSNINWLDLTELALLGLIALLKALHEQRHSGLEFAEPKVSRLRALILFLIPIALVATVLGLLSYLLHKLHYTPVNVLAVLMLSLAIFSEKFEALFADEK